MQREKELHCPPRIWGPEPPALSLPIHDRPAPTDGAKRPDRGLDVDDFKGGGVLNSERFTQLTGSRPQERGWIGHGAT